MNTIYILDFDDTLCNTSFANGTKELLFSLAADNSQGKAVYDEVKTQNNGLFVLEPFVSKLGLTVHTAKEQLAQKDWSQTMLPDSARFLQRLQTKPQNHCIVLTYGDPEWQKTKLDLSGLDSLIDGLIMTQDKQKKHDILGIQKTHPDARIIYIDDSIQVQPNDFPFPIDIIKMDRNGQDPRAIQSFDEIAS